MSSEDNLFELMFKHAEKISLEEFNDEDLEKEGIVIPEIDKDDVALEGIVTAVLGDIGRNYTDAYREIKGWFQGIESKRRHINEACKDTIEWLKEEDRDNPKVSLDMGKFKTWMKTSETFYWRYYFVLHDEIYNDIIKQIKRNEISELEVMTDFNMKDRMKVTRMIDSVNEIKDLVILIERYRARCETIFETMLKRKRRIQSFPFQILSLGFNDLNRTVKKIVNLAT